MGRPSTFSQEVAYARRLLVELRAVLATAIHDTPEDLTETRRRVLTGKFDKINAVLERMDSENVTAS